MPDYTLCLLNHASSVGAATPVSAARDTWAGHTRLAGRA
jgi:hypothetical protein